jgi:plastocyanin
MKRRFWILGFTVVAMVALAMLGGAQQVLGAGPEPKPAPGSEVMIDNFSFAPATVTVPVGGQVTWINHDDMPHTVVSGDKVFKSQVLDTGEKFTYTFTKPGTYSYFCSLHPQMTATVVVR